MLIGAAVLLLFLIAVLAIPVTLRFQVFWRDTLEDDVSLRWAFGLLRLRIPLSRPKKTAPEDERPKKTDRVERTPKKKRNFLAALRQKRFRQRVFAFFGDLWRAVHKNDISLRVRLGLGDPADTGQLWAIVGPLAGMLAAAREASIAIEPEFSDATFELETSGSIQIIPLQMIYLALALVFSPAVWHGIRAMRTA